MGVVYIRLYRIDIYQIQFKYRSKKQGENNNMHILSGLVLWFQLDIFVK